MTDFATQALQRIQQSEITVDDDSFCMPALPLFEAERRLAKKSSSGSFKRSRHESSFDMSDFLEASKQVEDSIAFPAIEWPSFDSGDESDDDCFSAPSSKRHCRGLVRCNRSSDLSSLISVSTLATTNNTTQRCGSNGSLA